MRVVVKKRVFPFAVLKPKKITVLRENFLRLTQCSTVPGYTKGSGNGSGTTAIRGLPKSAVDVVPKRNFFGKT